MLPVRRCQPELHEELAVVFQESIEATEGRTEFIAQSVAIYAERGRQRIGQAIENGGASPTEFAQMILRLADFYPKEFEKLHCLQPIRAKLERLLNGKPAEVIPFQAPQKRLKDVS